MPVSSGSGLADPERNPFSPNCYQRKRRYRISLLSAGRRLQESEWIQGSSGHTRREGGKAMRGNIVRTGGFLAASLVLLAAFAGAASAAGFAAPEGEDPAGHYVNAGGGEQGEMPPPPPEDRDPKTKKNTPPRPEAPGPADTSQPRSTGRSYTAE